MGSFNGAAITSLFRDYLVLVTRFSRSSKTSPEIPAHRLPDFKLVLPSKRQGMRLLIDSMLASSGIVLKPEIELDSLGPTLDLVRTSGSVQARFPVTAPAAGVVTELAVREGSTVDYLLRLQNDGGSGAYQIAGQTRAKVQDLPGIVDVQEL